MSSWKCTNCGIVNFATAEVCRRCQLAAPSGYAVNQNLQPLYPAQPPQHTYQTNALAPQTNYQTGNLAQPAPSQTAKPSANQTPYPNDYLNQPNDGQYYSSAPTQPPPTPYTPDPGYQPNNGYAYQNGHPNNGNAPGQIYPNYPPYNYASDLNAANDYSQAPTYGAPAMAAYQAAYPRGYGAQCGIWREGKKLVMHKHAYLPDRCVKCNAPTDGEYLHRKLSWLHPAWALLILASWLIYLIVYLAIRKKAEVDLGLCERHRADRRTFLGISWGAALLGIGCFMLAIGIEKLGFILLGILLLLFGIIFGIFSANIISVAKMDDNYIWMRRVNEDFLANFPPTGNF
ncbi:MAG: hypothetical protein HY231_12220 [Acidobacteria bacterium]|nr:hypothetical protein [Acidobacteriota bacterium]